MQLRTKNFVSLENLVSKMPSYIKLAFAIYPSQNALLDVLNAFASLIHIQEDAFYARNASLLLLYHPPVQQA